MSEKKKTNGCLVGCLTIVGIAVAGFILVAAIIFFKGEDLLMQVLNGSKEGISLLLTEDHTDEEKSEFQDVFTSLIDEINVLGFKEGVMQNKKIIKELQVVLEDRRITRSESEKMMKLFFEG